MLFFGLVLAAVLFVFLAKLAGVLTTRLSERFVSSRFRAAESLLEDGEIPAGWMEASRRVDGAPQQAALLRRLEGLTRYFEKCPFFEDQETRELMLGRLREIADQWRGRDWSETLADYGSPSREAEG